MQILGHVSQTNATIFSDDGITTTSNPTITDASGRYQFYVANGRYDIKITATGFTTFTLSDIDIHDETDITVPGETPLPGNLIFAGNNVHSGTETFANINKQFYVDGVTYTTVQAAMTAANAAGGGIVWVPDGTYVGPTTWFSDVAVVAEHNVRPNICGDVAGINCVIATSTNTAGVVFAYTTGLILTDLTRIAIIGITLDFNGASGGNLTFAGISYSQFDFSIRHAILTAPGLTLTNSTNNNTALNNFYYLQIGGGSEGLLCNGAAANRFVTDNWFGQLFLFETAAPAGTYTALDLKQNCDTNTFDEVGFISGQSAANGIIINSQSTTTDQDANGLVIKYFWSSGGPFTSGVGITFNPSTGNSVVAGVLNWTTKISVASGGATNSPAFNLVTIDPTVGQQTSTQSNLFQAVSPNASSSTGYQFVRSVSGVPTLQWNNFLNTSNGLQWMNPSNAQMLGLNTVGTLDVGALVGGTGTGVIDAGNLLIDAKGNFLSTDVFTNSTGGGSSAKKVAFRAGVGQGTNNLVEWQNSSGTPLLAVNSSGVPIPNVAGAIDLGTTALPFGNLWLGTAATNNFKFQPATAAAARVVQVNDPGTTPSALLLGGTNLLISPIAPTFSTHFNTSGDSIVSNGTASFTITVGTGTATNTGSLNLPTATTGWTCWLTNTNRAALIQQTGSTTASATFTNFGTTFAATNWTNSDVLRGGCTAN